MYQVGVSDALQALYNLIPQVPCNGCYDCCNGVVPGSLRCVYLDSDNKCSIRNRRPIDCRLYGAVHGEPCFRGRMAANPITPQMADEIRRTHKSLTGRNSVEPI
jgi:hypothetical protein